LKNIIFYPVAKLCLYKTGFEEYRWHLASALQLVCLEQLNNTHCALMAKKRRVAGANK